jgi:histone deacetylase complex regulatory component SIN3
MSVHKKLMQARVKLQSVDMKKSGQNKFAGYSYFELGDFIPHVQTIFNDLGLCGVVTFNTEYAQLCITDVEDGTVIVITTPMAEANLKGAHPIQNLGAVLSYQRRYLWMAAMELVEGDAVDSAPPVEAPKPVATQTPAPAPKPAQKPVKQRPDPIPPQHVEPDAWTIIIDAPDNPEAWVDMMVAANALKVSMATSAEQLKEMFQVNKALYGKLKELNPAVYADVMDTFANAKRSFF